jgi:hypothetical protein
MKVPAPRKLPSGSWFIQLRLGGESIPVTAATAKDCTREAAAIKAEWLARKRLPEKPEEPEQEPTLTVSIDEYIKRKSRTLFSFCHRYPLVFYFVISQHEPLHYIIIHKSDFCKIY